MATGAIHHSQESQNSIKIEDITRFAVAEQNKKENLLLEFKEVTNVKEQVVAGIMYYKTLAATDGGNDKVYDAKVWVKQWMNFKQVEEFKPVWVMLESASLCSTSRLERMAHYNVNKNLGMF